MREENFANMNPLIFFQNKPQTNVLKQTKVDKTYCQ